MRKKYKEPENVKRLNYYEKENKKKVIKNDLRQTEKENE